MEAAEEAQAQCYNILKSGSSKPCDHLDVQLKGKGRKPRGVLKVHNQVWELVVVGVLR